VPEDGARFNPFPGAPKPNVSCPPLDNQYETCILPPSGGMHLWRTNRVISFKALWTCSS
jgi:hypothetical protein